MPENYGDQDFFQTWNLREVLGSIELSFNEQLEKGMISEKQSEIRVFSLFCQNCVKKKFWLKE